LRDLTGSGLVGTGPYRIASTAPRELTLERNPRVRAWSQDARPDGYPDRIVWFAAPAGDQAAVRTADVVMDPVKSQLDRLTVEAPTRTRSCFDRPPLPDREPREHHYEMPEAPARGGRCGITTDPRRSAATRCTRR
jgi:hypothetical protein